MKKMNVLTMVLFTITIAAAQPDAGYKGAGKAQMQAFWRQAEMYRNGKGSEMTMGNMKRALENFKEKDPAYNTAAMDAEYNKWKADAEKKGYESLTPEAKALADKLAALNYSGPAKGQVEHFWRYAFKCDGGISESELNYAIREMEYAVKATMEKDPAVDAAEMEDALKKIKDGLKAKKLAEVRQAGGDKRSSRPPEKVSNDPVVLMEQLFIEKNISVGSTSDLPEVPGKIAAYKATMDKLLAMDYTDALIKKGRFAKGSISGFANITGRELDKVDGYLKQAREMTGMAYMYYTIQYHLAFWNAAQKVFPEEATYADMHKKVAAAVITIGSLDQLYAKAEANRVEHIKNTKLPAAVVKDARLEKILTDGFNKVYGTSRNVSALKAVLTQNGWTTLRNSLTGIVVGRERSAKLAYKGSDGKCYLLPDYVFIREDYVGSSFINTVAVFNGLDGEEMLCENLK